MRRLASEGVTTYVEVGPGTVLERPGPEDPPRRSRGELRAPSRLRSWRRRASPCSIEIRRQRGARHRRVARDWTGDRTGSRTRAPPSVAAARGEARPRSWTRSQAGGGKAESVSRRDRSRGVDALVGGSSTPRAHRHPGEQRRHRARSAARADEARRLGRRARDQPDGGLRARQAALRPMMQQRAGRIMTISSVVGQMGNAGQANTRRRRRGSSACQGAGAEVARGITGERGRAGLIDTDMTRPRPDEPADMGPRIPSAAWHACRRGRVACFRLGEAAYIHGAGHRRVNGGMYACRRHDGGSRQGEEHHRGAARRRRRGR